MRFQFEFISLYKSKLESERPFRHRSRNRTFVNATTVVPSADAEIEIVRLFLLPLEVSQETTPCTCTHDGKRGLDISNTAMEAGSLRTNTEAGCYFSFL